MEIFIKKAQRRAIIFYKKQQKDYWRWQTRFYLRFEERWKSPTIKMINSIEQWSSQNRERINISEKKEWFQKKCCVRIWKISRHQKHTKSTSADKTSSIYRLNKNNCENLFRHVMSRTYKKRKKEQKLAKNLSTSQSKQIY